MGFLGDLFLLLLCQVLGEDHFLLNLQIHAGVVFGPLFLVSGIGGPGFIDVVGVFVPGSALACLSDDYVACFAKFLHCLNK